MTCIRPKYRCFRFSVNLIVCLRSFFLIAKSSYDLASFYLTLLTNSIRHVSVGSLHEKTNRKVSYFRSSNTLIQQACSWFLEVKQGDIEHDLIYGLLDFVSSLNDALFLLNCITLQSTLKSTSCFVNSQ